MINHQDVHFWKMRLYNLAVHRRWNLPTNIGMEISTACNRRCYYCPQSTEPKKQEVVTREMWKLFIDRLYEFGWRGVTTLHCYNELSVVKNSWQYVQELSILGTLPYLFSNGDRPEVVEEWVRAGAHRVVITEHPPFRPEWWERLRPVAERHPHRIRVQKLSPDQIYDHAGKLPDVPTFALTKCYAPWGMIFTHTGKLRLCCLDYGPSYSFGDLTHQSIEQIWRGETFTNVRRLVRMGESATPLCRGCFFPDKKK